MNLLGGTLDITAHQIVGPDHIREIHRVSGSDLGGVKVDQLFMQHLVVLFGEENITNIKTCLLYTSPSPRDS